MQKYITEFTNKNGEVYGWYVLANSFEEAQDLVDKRGINEIILGVAD
jgi:hypothetical protein